METAEQARQASELGMRDSEHQFKMMRYYNDMPCFERKTRLHTWILNRILITIDFHKVHSNAAGDPFDVLRLDREAYVLGFLDKFKEKYWNRKSIKF